MTPRFLVFTPHPPLTHTRTALHRLILENLLKYGWRLNFISYISRSLAGRGNLPLVLAFPALVALSLLALAVERLGLYCLKVEEQVGVLQGGGSAG